MANTYKKTEAHTLEQYRVALNNVQQQPIIASAMAELGYENPKIIEGTQLLEQTRAAFDFNKQEDDETNEASAKFKAEKAKLDELYRLHRKKAKVTFRKQPETLKRLELLGKAPTAYTNWIESIKKLYNNITDQEIQQLATIKLTQNEVDEGKNLINAVEAARSEYLREVGESQDATKQKDAAFAKMEDWMRDFYAVAAIALDDKPQMMEALGKLRKS